MLTYLWNPSPIAFVIPIIDLPIAWYGVCFAAGLWISMRLARRFVGCCDGRFSYLDAGKLVERLGSWAAAGVIVGARLAHCICYDPAYYFAHPMAMLNLREGGLASHGGVIGLAIALMWAARRYKISWGSMSDLAALSFAPAAVAIRIGNFINQEVLGVPTGGDWGILFMSPRGMESVVPRHPAQLYEAFIYAIIGLLMWLLLSYKDKKAGSGWFAGLSLALVFSARFAVEFIKEEQAAWLGTALNMGQWLSLPLIFAGVILMRYSGQLRAKDIQQ